MNAARLNEIVNAVLYEGYILYPYRASSIKNQRERFTFGRVYPKWYSEEQKGAEPCVMQTECLVESAAPDVGIEIVVRFLQPAWGKAEPKWQEALEREVKVEGSGQKRFRFDADERSEAIEGEVEVAMRKVEDGLFRLTVRITNTSAPARIATQPVNQAILMTTFTSTHTILTANGGAKFVSLMDPLEKWKEAATACKNVGTWPVLVGDEAKGERDAVLSSPIILYDYPQIAPESLGNLFDSTEIDEMLTLRIMTMTPEEKTEMRNVDAHARALLERTEALSSADMLGLHGARREPMRSFDEQIFGSNTRLDRVAWKDGYLKCGDRVRIRPKARADVMDLALAGRTAVIEAVEQDAEMKIHLALVLDDDPGRELGFERQIGHRFFFGLDEVEAVEPRKRILIAGIGNIFMGDDAFGCEVIRALPQRPMAEWVKAIDFGIRSYDLAYALTEDYEAVILVDAVPRGAEPGTVFLIEPEVNGFGKTAMAADAHTMNPVAVIQMAERLGGIKGKLYLVGCEPRRLEGDDGEIGLSAEVRTSVGQATEMIERLVNELLEKEGKNAGATPV